MARIKRNMQRELEKEGDKLNEVVDVVFDEKL